jgi:hypothetical protein
MQPRDADSISFLYVSDTRAQRHHDTSTFMPRDKWRSRFDRPIAIGGVQVGVTYAGRDDLD